MLNWLKKLKVSGKRRRSGTSSSEQKETGTEPSVTAQPAENTEQKHRKSRRENQKQDPRAGKTSRKKSRVSRLN